MRILVVEDHIALQEGVVNYFKYNHPEMTEVIAVNDGEKALKILKEQPFDYLITDLNLPKLNGIELVEQLRSFNPTIAILVLTMYYNKAIITNLKTFNIQGFLTKNVSLSEIGKALAHISKNQIYVSPEVKNLYNNKLIFNEDN